MFDNLTIRPKGKNEKLPKKMKRLVVLETTAGASFADLKDYKVCICFVVNRVE